MWYMKGWVWVMVAKQWQPPVQPNLTSVLDLSAVTQRPPWPKWEDHFFPDLSSSVWCKTGFRCEAMLENSHDWVYVSSMIIANIIDWYFVDLSY